MKTISHNIWCAVVSAVYSMIVIAGYIWAFSADDPIDRVFNVGLVAAESIVCSPVLLMVMLTSPRWVK